MQRILVVDDESSILEVVQKYLAREGFQVSTARDGEMALATFNKQPSDLVVLDLMLPKIDGLEVIRRLRTRSAVPVIMLTAKGEETDRVVGLELGADDYITKPFSPASWWRASKRCCAGAPLRMQRLRASDRSRVARYTLIRAHVRSRCRASRSN